MKKIRFLLIFLLLAYAQIVSPSGMNTTLGTWTTSGQFVQALYTNATAVCHIATVANGAMFEIVGVDLSPYLGRFVRIYDGSKYISGYIKAACGGETLGSDLATNGNFDAGDTGWTKEGGWTIVDQGVGDFEGVATNVIINTLLYQAVSGLTKGKLYKVSGVCSNFTDGSLAVWAISAGAAYWGTILAGTGTSTFVFAATATTHNVGFNASTAGSDFRVDDFTLYEVTDLPVTGVTIVSTLGGATQSWTEQESEFNPNAATFVVTIYGML